MTDAIYLYPQSSCPTDRCLKRYPIPGGQKSNLAIKGCHPSPYFDCYGSVEIQRRIIPEDKQGITDLNPQAYTNKLAKGFDAMKCSDKDPNTFYLSRDPRQYDAMRAEYIPLDSIPISGAVKLKNIYSAKYEDYGNIRTSYDGIRDGQIVYYNDKSIQDAFYKPVYSEPAEEISGLYKDPMGSMKPEYNRKALVNTENPTTTTAKSYPYCLSYIQDSQSFREDIIALQQRKNNQEKWSARWSSTDT